MIQRKYRDRLQMEKYVFWYDFYMLSFSYYQFESFIINKDKDTNFNYSRIVIHFCSLISENFLFYFLFTYVLYE